MPYIDRDKIPFTFVHGRFDDVYVSQEKIMQLPTADVQEVKHGKWTEKQVIHAEEVKIAIEEWQSCRCSVCGRYDTRPYMYYFSEPKFCSWCGADMREESGDG